MDQGRSWWIDIEMAIFLTGLALLAGVIVLWYRFRRKSDPVVDSVCTPGKSSDADAVAVVAKDIEYIERCPRLVLGPGDLEKVRDLFSAVGSGRQFFVDDRGEILRCGTKCGEVVKEREWLVTLQFYDSLAATHLESLIELTWPDTRWVGELAVRGIEIVRAKAPIGRPGSG